ncbi:PREDICTED: CST complex subunit CTC1 [Nanorana parkeri]|uniref:CST complex subunit CTC1 n=1 Tax=Nanorana parkeri TaxID=125878 RepID=UPI0008546C5D|nr:PREDICTED: CST complex subunit CTC1 [Nanorana parkeri]
MEAERPPGAQVSGWLQAAHRHALDFLQYEGGAEAPELCNDVIRCIQTFCPQLPLSYSFTSVSQLLSLQKSPCVTALGWDTERFQQWSHEGQQQTKVSQPPPVLSRARLLLVGYLSDCRARDGPVHDGNLYIRDASGCVPCEMSNLDLSLLGSLVLFPCWSYIPTQHGGGYVEVLSPPISVTSPVVRPELLDEARATALTPDQASKLLCSRSHPRGFRVSVIGRMTSITSLINIRDKPFFFFFLQDATKSVPVIVKVSQKLSWYHAVHIGNTCMVTSLSVSSLRGSAQQIFAVTPSSCLILHPALSPPCSSSLTKENSQERTAPSAGGEEQRFNPQEKIREKQQKMSKTLTYEGVVTRVRDAGAGLYELDAAVVLCTAYTQLPNGGRGLREGARVEVCDVHLQQSPSPLFPTIVLSTCLRSRVRVFEFSHLSAPCPVYSTSGNLYLHLLFHYRLTLPEYLWVCDVMGKLQDKLRPPLLRPRCLTRHTGGSSSHSVIEKLLDSSLSLSGGRRERDLCEEMVASPHNCPLQEYSPLPPPWCLPPLSDFSSLACKSQYLRRRESNQSLGWCHYCLPSEDLSPPHVLLGVLHASSSGFLQLKDHSSSLTCLILPIAPIGWIGCVLEVRQYQLVVETLQCKDTGIEERNRGRFDIERQQAGEVSLRIILSSKRCIRAERSYAVFLAEDVTVLHSPQTCPWCSVAGPSGPSPSKVRRVETSWARRLLLIHSMEGMLTLPDHRKGLQFQVKASWRDMKESSCRGQDGGQSTEVPKDGDKVPSKVSLLFTSSSVRWFPLLQPNRQYQIIASKETDAGIFDSLSECGADMPRAPRCLKVPSDWILEDVENSDHSYNAESFSIEEAVKSSSSGSLVSVSGAVSSRSMCGTQTVQRRARSQDNFLPPGVSIKLILTQPVSQSSVSVYLDLTLGPYPLGLLPGATVLMQGLERKVSRSGKTYLRSVPTTYICVLSPPTEISDSQPAPPLVLFRQLSGLPSPQRAVCSVTFVLSVTLSWDCSMCCSPFTQSSGSFKCIENFLYLGFRCFFICNTFSVWEALQRQVLARGRVAVRNRGRSELPSEEHSEDALADHVTSLMSRPAVSRPFVVTFRQTGVGGAQTSGIACGPVHLTRFTRGDREYVTRIPSPPTLTCLQLEEVEPRLLCQLIRERRSCDC